MAERESRQCIRQLVVHAWPPAEVHVVLHQSKRQLETSTRGLTLEYQREHGEVSDGGELPFPQVRSVILDRPQHRRGLLFGRKRPSVRFRAPMARVPRDAFRLSGLLRKSDAGTYLTGVGMPLEQSAPNRQALCCSATRGTKGFLALFGERSISMCYVNIST